MENDGNVKDTGHDCVTIVSLHIQNASLYTLEFNVKPAFPLFSFLRCFPAFAGDGSMENIQVNRLPLCTYIAIISYVFVAACIAIHITSLI